MPQAVSNQHNGNTVCIILVDNPLNHTYVTWQFEKYNKFLGTYLPNSLTNLLLLGTYV